MWDERWMSRRIPPALQLLILQSPARAVGEGSKGAMLFQLLSVQSCAGEASVRSLQDAVVTNGWRR